MWLELVVYRHPQQNLKSFSLAFQNTLKKLKRFTKFVVLGDFNIDYGCYNTSSAVKSYADNTTSLGCEQLITWPTRISSTNRQSILDHVYVDSCVMINDVITTAVIESDISDHFPTLIQIKCKISIKKSPRPFINKIKSQDIEKFVENLDEQFQCDKSSLSLKTIIESMTNVIDKTFPKIRLSRKQYQHSKKPWITRDILKSIKHQNKLFAKYKTSGNECDFKSYKQFRNKTTHAKEAAKAAYYQNLLGKSNSSSMAWKTINPILRKNKRTQTSLPSELNVNEKAIQNPSTICDELNQHFCNIGHKLAKPFNASPLEFISQSFRGQRIKNSFYLESISENEVLEIITGLNPNKAPGVEEIPTKLIKAAK